MLNNFESHLAIRCPWHTHHGSRLLLFFRWMPVVRALDQNLRGLSPGGGELQSCTRFSNGIRRLLLAAVVLTYPRKRYDRNHYSKGMTLAFCYFAISNGLTEYSTSRVTTRFSHPPRLSVTGSLPADDGYAAARPESVRGHLRGRGGVAEPRAFPKRNKKTAACCCWNLAPKMVFPKSLFQEFCSFVRSSVRSFVCSFLPSFLPSYLPFFLPSFLPSFLPFFLSASFTRRNPRRPKSLREYCEKWQQRNRRNNRTGRCIGAVRRTPPTSRVCVL